MALTSGATAWAHQAQLSQQDVVAQALKVAPTILAARQKVDEAKAHVSEVTAQRRFQLTLSGSVSTSYGQIAEPPSLQGYETVEGMLSAPIPNVGRADAAIDQASAAYVAAEIDLRRNELDVEFRANQAYIEYLRAQETESISKANLDQAERQEADTQARIKAGDVPAADLLKTQVPVAQNRAAFARAKLAVSEAQETLNDLLQRNLDAPINLSVPIVFTPSKLDADAAVAASLKHSPDVLEAEANLRAAQAGLRQARHSRDTDLSLQLSHTRSSDPTAYSYVTSLALNFSLPIIDGGASKAQIHEAESQVKQAETAKKLALQQTRIAVKHAVLDIEGDEANLTASAATADIAKQSLDKARQAYAAGLTTTRDVLDAQLVYSQSLIELNSAKFDFAIAQAKLTQLLGGNRP